VQGLWQGDLKKAGDALRVTHVAKITPDLWRNFTELHLCRDFGHLSCLAMNEMGGMKEGGCLFHVTAAGPPQPPTACSIINQTTDLLQVKAKITNVLHLNNYVVYSEGRNSWDRS
jgi:hypothetical protein